MGKHNIMAVVLNQRSKEAPNVQEIFTKYGCAIKMRLGLHETEDICTDEGLILLHMGGDQGMISALECELNGVNGVKAKTLSISSPE
jgi:metal-responsive CopG/Arc/MetJ family transcriptional regulator